MGTICFGIKVIMLCHPYYIGAAERLGKSTAMNVLVPATYSDAFVEDSPKAR